MGNIFCSTCCCEGTPEPLFGEFLKPARFSGAVPSRYVVMSLGKIEYFDEKDNLSRDPFKGKRLKGYINLYEYVLERNPKNPLMLNFVRSTRKQTKSRNPDEMPTSTRVSSDRANSTMSSSFCYLLCINVSFFLFSGSHLYRSTIMNSNAKV